MRFLQRLAHVCTVAAAAWFAFWACAPPSTLPPPIPMAAGGLHLSAAVVPGIAAEDAWREQEDGSLRMTYTPRFVVDGRVSITAVGQGPRPCQVSLLAFGGTTTQGGGGGMLRCDLARDERLYMGPQGEIGWYWLGLGLPVAYQPSPRLVLYTSPSFRLSHAQQVLLPVGVAWKTDGRVWLNAELSARPHLGEILSSDAGLYDQTFDDIYALAIGASF